MFIWDRMASREEIEWEDNEREPIVFYGRTQKIQPKIALHLEIQFDSSILFRYDQS